jgi:hypothetical protein
MSLPPIVRRAIFDRQGPSRSRGMKFGSATTSVIIRLTVAPERIRNIDGRERQLNLTAREISCLQPFEVTLFGNKDLRRKVRLIINRRRAYLLSVTNSGIVVFTYAKGGVQ